MKTYCKAYYLGDLRKYPEWHEPSASEGEGLTEKSIVYMWEDYTVVKSPIISGGGIIFDAVTPAWQEFCNTALHFAIPDDVKRMRDATHADGQPDERPHNK